MNLTIAATISLIGCCVTIPLFVRFGYHLQIGFLMKTVLFLISIGIAVLPVFASPEFAERFFGPFALMMQYILYFIYITAVILFSITLFRDVIWTLLALVFEKIPSPFNGKALSSVNLYTFILAFLCAISALYAGLRVPAVKEIEIFSNSIKKEKTIVVLSDLHLSRSVFPSKIKGIVKAVNALNPDIVVMPGDTVDDKPLYTQELVKELGNLKARQGVYFTSGNHEFYVGYHTSVQQLQSEGFRLLDNNSVNLDYVCLAGIPDYPSAKRNGMPVNQNDLCQDVLNYRILLSHTPISPVDAKADLVISGHTHGGQIFPFHLFSWLFNSRFLAGLYQVTPSRGIYVTRGSGQWGPQMRFLAPAEITVLKLRP